MRIYLVGFMGSGKTTLAKQVASVFNVPLVDTDQEVELREGKFISEIFHISGELHFRNLEHQVLEETSSLPKAIIATGGGLPSFGNNMEWILRNGISIYLQWPFPLLRQNLLTQKSKRPLLSSLSDQEAAEKINELMNERLPFYELSAMTIEMTGDQEKDLAALIKACKYLW